MSHELQVTSRSLLLEGKARLNTIKQPSSSPSAVQQLPRHEVGHSVHYALRERASARRAHGQLGRANQRQLQTVTILSSATPCSPPAVVWGTQPNCQGMASLQVRNSSTQRRPAVQGGGSPFFTKLKASPWGARGELEPNRACNPTAKAWGLAKAILPEIVPHNCSYYDRVADHICFRDPNSAGDHYSAKRAHVSINVNEHNRAKVTTRTQNCHIKQRCTARGTKA
jgi:hypothetical protein